MRNKYLLYILMFFYFASGAIMFPYLAIHLSKNLNPSEIGTLMAIIPTSMLLLQPFWGWAADKWGAGKVLRFTLIFTILSAGGFLFVTSFNGFFTVLLIYSIFAASINSLIDATVLSLRNDKYGSIRLWGSIGYGVAAFLGGLFKSSILGFWSFAIHIALLAVTLLIVLRLPNTKCAAANKKASKRNRIDFSHFYFFKNTRFIILLFSLFLTGVVLKGYEIFFPVGLNNLKASGVILGSAWVIEIIPEVFLFYYLDRIIGKISPWLILISGTVLYIARVGILGFFPVLWIWVVSQPVSSLAFALWYFGAVKLVNKMVDEGQKSTGLAVFWSVSYGAGGLTGSFFSGQMVNTFGIFSYFKVAAVICCLSAMILIYLSKTEKSSASYIEAQRI